MIKGGKKEEGLRVVKGGGLRVGKRKRWEKEGKVNGGEGGLR